MNEDDLLDHVIENGVKRRIDRLEAPSHAREARSLVNAVSSHRRPVVVRPAGGVSLGLIVAVALVAGGILVFRTGQSPASGGAPAPSIAVSNPVASPPPAAASGAVELSRLDLPGPVYDLTFDRGRILSGMRTCQVAGQPRCINTTSGLARVRTGYCR